MMMKRFAIVLMLGTSACTSLDPHLAQPGLPVPASWPVGDAYLRSSEAPLPAVTYAQLFVDPGLQSLIALGLRNNRDLRVAAYNIAAARAQLGITRSNQLPEVDAGGSVRLSGNRSSGSSSATGTGGSGSGTGGTSDGSTSGSSGGITTRVNYAADVQASYEVDIFGRLASLTRADQQRLFATEAAARATRLSLVANIADAWTAYAADSSLLSIADQTVRSAQESVRLTDLRLRGGVAPRTDLLQAEQILETARSDAALQRAARAQDVNALQLLVGAPVDPRFLQSSIDDAARTFVALPAGLDSRVLLRRPDVLQSEFALRAANAEIGAARAALFPQISLTGVLGLASTALTSLLSAGALSFSAGPAISYPIFNAGRTRARVQQTEAQRQAALATYEKTIQTAFREVSDELATRGTIGERLRAQQAIAAATADTLRLVTARYRGGIDPYLTTLDAQRSFYAAQRSQVAVKKAAANNAVALYRTLGADPSLAAAIPIN